MAYADPVSSDGTKEMGVDAYSDPRRGGRHDGLVRLQRGRESSTGAVPGANTGRVVGSPVEVGAGEPTIGPVEGGLMGAEVGRSLNDADRAIALKAEYEALEYGRGGQPTEWRSSSGQVSGKVAVGSVYQVNRLDCRDYTHSISIGGRMRVVKGHRLPPARRRLADRRLGGRRIPGTC